MGKKQLYEAVQALNAKIDSQNRVIQGLTTSSFQKTHKLNPAILNSAKYNTVLSVADKIQATNRYITDIPELELPSSRLEALFYEYGSLGFYREEDRPYVSMYSKSGALNRLGDLTEVFPIDFSGVTHSKKRTVVYDNSLTSNPFVIINDYTGTYKEENILPRAVINSVSIDDQSRVYRQLVNSVKLTAKKAIALLENETQREAVESVVLEMLDNDSPVIGLVANKLAEVFDLHNIDTKLDIEGYLRAIEAYERMRANFNGIKTRSSVEKKERLITSEAENDNLLTEIYLYDGLIQRQVGIELMIKHAIIKTGSCKLNDLFTVKKENDSTKTEKEVKDE